MDEWLIYQRPEDFMPSLMLSDLVPMLAKDYDNWAENTATQYTRDRFPVVARGLTETQARAMIRLTKEREDEI